MTINIFRVSLFFWFGLMLVDWSAAQETPPEPPRPQVMPQPQLPRMNPAQLLKMRNSLTFELQQTQRSLGFIDPNDKLVTTLKEQQSELVNQLKEINAQLKAQGIPTDGEEPVAPTPPPEPNVPVIPKAIDPTLVPGGTPQLPADPNLMIQREPTPMGIFPGTPIINPALPPDNPYRMMEKSPSAQPYQPYSPPIQPRPTPFDQDQAWANSPWVPQPSKELTELKQTVDLLRKEISDLKENVKALETQIQLLNRNILLSQPTPK